MNKDVKDIFKAIEGAKKVLLVCHTDPDGDAIGSMLAMRILLKAFKKKITMYCPDPVPEIYGFLPHSEDIKHKLSPKAYFDLTIALDCGDIRRFNKHIDIQAITKMLVNIDHHPDNPKFGNINYIKPISSVSEIVYELFYIYGVDLTKESAEALYTGIMTDTGNFRYDYTSANTFRVASDLKTHGADISRIAMSIYETRTLSSMKILGAAMYRLESTKSGKVVWTALTKELMKSLGAESGDLTGIVDLIRSIKGAEVAILFREEKEELVKVNFRSKFKVNVSQIAKKLGGGGHIRASGCVVEGEMEKVKTKVLKEVFKVIK